MSLAEAEPLPITEASRRGVSKLVADAENGHATILRRHSQPVAAIISFTELQRLQGLERDLVDVAEPVPPRKRAADARTTEVWLTDPAVEDLQRLDDAPLVWALKKMLLLETDPLAGEPLLGSLIGYRKLVVDNRDWRLIWKASQDSWWPRCDHQAQSGPGCVRVRPSRSVIGDAASAAPGSAARTSVAVSTASTSTHHRSGATEACRLIQRQVAGRVQPRLLLGLE